MVLAAREVRETGCITLLLKDEDGSTNERAKPAMQAMETVVNGSSFISSAVGVVEEECKTEKCIADSLGSGLPGGFGNANDLF